MGEDATTANVEPPEAEDTTQQAEDVEPVAMEVQQEPLPPVDLSTRDEASRPSVVVRELTYAWQQTDDEIKIYVPFDQHEELQNAVSEDRMTCEFGEWSLLLVIRSTVEGRAPLGLRLGDFHRRVLPDKCTCTIRGSRITLKLVKRAKENWWNFLQNAPIHD